MMIVYISLDKNKLVDTNQNCGSASVSAFHLGNVEVKLAQFDFNHAQLYFGCIIAALTHAIMYFDTI